MASYNLVAGFNILLQDSAPSSPNFGTMGIIAYHDLGPYKRVYDTTNDGLNAMVVDGFALTSDIYKKVAAVKKQLPKVKQVKIFNRAAPNAQAYTLTPTNTNPGIKYEFSVNDIPISYTNGAGETVAAICGALQTQIDDVANVTATDNTTDVGLALTAATGARMYIKGAPSYLTVKDTSPDAGIAADLTAASLQDDDFYGVLIDSMSELEINAAAAWCETYRKIGHFQTLDSDVLTGITTDVASDLQAAGYTYSGVFYSRDPGAQLASCVMGRQFALDPGKSTWENQELVGVVADDLSGTEIDNAKAKNCSLFLPYSTSLSMTHAVASGEGRFFDITRDRDWFGAITQTAIVAFFARIEKAPANQSGIDQLEAVVRPQFELAETAGVLDPGWSLTLPTAAQLPNLKATRRFTASDAFYGEFQGAIHGADIGGTLSTV